LDGCHWSLTFIPSARVELVQKALISAVADDILGQRPLRRQRSRCVDKAGGTAH
jgi:hypothetical protein